jgi:hypothetical protein
VLSTKNICRPRLHHRAHRQKKNMPSPPSPPWSTPQKYTCRPRLHRRAPCQKQITCRPHLRRRAARQKKKHAVPTFAAVSPPKENTCHPRLRHLGPRQKKHINKLQITCRPHLRLLVPRQKKKHAVPTVATVVPAKNTIMPSPPPPPWSPPKENSSITPTHICFINHHSTSKLRPHRHTFVAVLTVAQSHFAYIRFSPNHLTVDPAAPITQSI